MCCGPLVRISCPWPPLDILRSNSVRALAQLSTAYCRPQHAKQPRREPRHKSNQQRVLFSHAGPPAVERACSVCADPIAHLQRAQHDPVAEPTVRWKLCRRTAAARLKQDLSCVTLVKIDSTFWRRSRLFSEERSVALTSFLWDFYSA